ncbi:MAG: hypothetical protein UGE23_12300 [Peptococcaceae bacterium]|nr:hypothetical protein [Peptococcaceae bacterium]
MKDNANKLIRDIDIGTNLLRRAELGGFEKEFHVYGLAYYKDNQREYLLGSDLYEIYKKQQEYELSHIISSTIQSYSSRSYVTLDNIDIMVFDAKLKLARQLKDTTDLELFQWLTTLSSHAQEDYAYPILQELCQQIEGYFNQDKLHSLHSLIQYAYGILALSDSHYKELMTWLKDELHFMGNVPIRQDIYNKTYYGIAYLKNDRIYYEEDALPDCIVRKIDELEHQNLITTFIFKQKLYYSYTKNLFDIHNEFVQNLQNHYDDNYMNIMQTLTKKCNAKIDTNWLSANCLKLQGKYSEEKMKTVYKYLHKWRLAGLLR